MGKYTFKLETDQDTDLITKKIIIETHEVSLNEIIISFVDFLRASGFSEQNIKDYIDLE